jgi:hypothetical protein
MVAGDDRDALTQISIQLYIPNIDQQGATSTSMQLYRNTIFSCYILLLRGKINYYLAAD